MGKYVECDCHQVTKSEYKNLLRAIGDYSYGLLGDSLYIPVDEWKHAKKRILRQAKKFKSVQYGLVEVTDGQPKHIVPPSEIFSETFLEMERSLKTI